MSLNFSELKGLSTYNFKKDKGISIIIKDVTDNLEDLKKVYFIVTNNNGDVLYQSKKGCFEVVGYKKLIRTGNLFFGRYDTVNSKKIKFKCDKHGYSKDLLKFREFCSDRRSGSEIYNLLLSVMGQYNVALEQGHNFSNLAVKG